MAYEQWLYDIEKLKLQDIRKIEKLNRTKSWEYGYDDDWDFVVISKTGQIDPHNIHLIQGLRIAIPPPPDKEDIAKETDKEEDQVWFVHEVPEAINKIKDIFTWNNQPMEFKEEYIDYIGQCFEWRRDGYWFMNNGEPTYITGSHYMFMTWSHIDIGLPDYRQANRYFWYFWEACKADYRSYGMCYLKNRRSGFSYMAAAEISNLASLAENSRYGILSKTREDAKLLFADKVVRIVNMYPFFFRPVMAGSDKPKSEMVFDTPARKLTRSNIQSSDMLDGVKGLNTSIDFKATGDYSYDGEKLKLLIQDESGKWERPNNVITNHGVTRTCCRVGLDIVGKIMMGSTAGALAKGGEEFRTIYEGGDLREVKRNGIAQTPYGLYSLFIPMEWNFEGTFDKYGASIFEDPETPILRYGGDPKNKRHFVKQGALTIWKAEYEGRKSNPDSQNEYLRQFPKSEKHAFRDEASNSLFNLTRLNDQLDYVMDLDKEVLPVSGNFHWENGIKDSRVRFEPCRNGRFRLAWRPKPEHTNMIVRKGNMKYPANEHLGSFGVDPYNISQAKTRGSAGAMVGITTHHFNADIAPLNTMFLEYKTRPPDADIFFEDILMASVYYGMPCLIENNKDRLLYYFKRRGYRGYSMNRPDKVFSKLSYFEKEVGGIPMTGKDVGHAHANGIESWINKFVGRDSEDQYGKNLIYEKTLNELMRFEFDNRTDYDATMAMGLAIMANQKHMYRPVEPREVVKSQLQLRKYDNSGMQSKFNKYG